MVAASDLQMMTGEYAFITLDFSVQEAWHKQSWAGGRTSTEFLTIFDGIINLSVKGPHGERFRNYTHNLREVFQANSVSHTSLVSIRIYVWEK